MTEELVLPKMTHFWKAGCLIEGSVLLMAETSFYGHQWIQAVLIVVLLNQMHAQLARDPLVELCQT